MANTPSDYSKFTITSRKDRYSHGYDIPDYERDMKAIVNQAVKSALSEGGYFKTSSRVVDKATGETKLDIFVHSADAKVVESAIKTELGKLTFRDSNGRPTQRPKYKVDTDTVTERESRALSREERGDGEATRFNRGAWLKVIGLLMTLVNITRRILSSVIDFSTQTARDMITAHNLGMSYESARRYRHVETAHGMKEGTMTDAVSGEQQKYGNITSLDEKSLEYIALIMGSKVEDMAKMGIGASNPEAIVEAIVDRANELANSGYNSIGQYVGEQQARRELYSYLLKYSPQIADIFATMQEEQHNINSLFRNQADTFAEWKSMLPTKRGGHIDAEYNLPATVGQEWNVVKDIYNQIKEGVQLTLAPWILSLLRRLENVRWGMSDREKKELDERHRNENTEFINSAKIQLSQLGDTEADKQRKMALEYYIKEAEKENAKKDGVASMVVTPDEIVVKGKELAETAIRFRVAMGQEGYSPAMKYVVDEYLDADKRKKVENKFLAEAQQQRRHEIATERLAEIESSPEYQEEMAKINDKYKGRFSTESRSKAKALLQARLLYGDKADFRYDKYGKERSLADQTALAWRAGYIDSSGGVTPNYYINTDKIDLTGEDFEEAIYIALYNKYKNILAGHLANELVEQSKEKASEGTVAYDLDVLQRKYGYDLSGLSEKLGNGTSGRIISSATREGDIITHKIVFDLNNNGKVEASDVLLESYITNRISDEGTVVNNVKVTNNGVSWEGTSSSGQKKRINKGADRI